MTEQYRNKQGLYDEMIMPALSKEVWNWFNKPLKKGVIFAVGYYHRSSNNLEK